MSGMIKIKAEHVQSIKYVAEDAVRIEVNHPELKGKVTYHASASDPQEHARELFQKAEAGEFGEISPYEPPTPLEKAREENGVRRTFEMQFAKQTSIHYGLIDDEESCAAWKAHYKRLYDLAKTEWWPLVEEWPVAPE